MGGTESEITDSTTEIAIESAVFDPVSIRRTGHRYALRSEASLRFEKGQEFRLARIGADRVAQLTLAWAGGVLAKGRVDTAPLEPEPARLAFRPSRVSNLLGGGCPAAEQRNLERVKFRTELGALDDGARMTSRGPDRGSWRRGGPHCRGSDMAPDFAVEADVPRKWRGNEATGAPTGHGDAGLSAVAREPQRRYPRRWQAWG
jgi:phenylalanyl-tRNA synthetase beta subunit